MSNGIIRREKRRGKSGRLACRPAPAKRRRTMKSRRRVIAIVGVVASWWAGACLLSGCGNGHSPKAGGSAPAQSTNASIPLPDWAPANPSREFLRAARVLKPMPSELLDAGARGDPTRAATIDKFTRVWPASYEFFGTLTDDQLKRFLSTGQIRIPVKDLTIAQKTALDNWFSAWQRAMKATGNEDFLVDLSSTRPGQSAISRTSMPASTCRPGTWCTSSSG